MQFTVYNLPFSLFNPPHQNTRPQLDGGGSSFYPAAICCFIYLSAAKNSTNINVFSVNIFLMIIEINIGKKAMKTMQNIILYLL